MDGCVMPPLPPLLFSRALLDMAIVEEGPNMEEEVRAREDTVYRIQLRLLEIQLRLLDEEERKLKLQERYATGDDLAGIQLRLERIPSKMSKLRLKMVGMGVWVGRNGCGLLVTSQGHGGVDCFSCMCQMITGIFWKGTFCYSYSVRAKLPNKLTRVVISRLYLSVNLRVHSPPAATL